MALNPCCAANQPVTQDYTPEGKRITLTSDNGGDFSVYTVGSGTSCLIIMYDIFGFDFNQVFQVADRLAKGADMMVVVPDVFRGEPWPKSNFPPKSWDDFFQWVATLGSYERVGKDLVAVKEHCVSQGAQNFGTLGFCWGALIAMQAGSVGPGLGGLGVKAAAGGHPSFFGKSKEVLSVVDCPVCLLPAEGDLPDLEELKPILEAKPFGSKCVTKRYDDQVHGFLASRGDWHIPAVAAAATEALGILADFFKANLN